jgi:hypothetical protein
MTHNNESKPEESFTRAGSQRWLQIAIAHKPELLDAALHRSGAIDHDDSVVWKSPLLSDNFREYQDEAALRCLGIAKLPKRSLADFWPKRGPVWDALGMSKGGRFVFVEAKAHIPEAASQKAAQAKPLWPLLGALSVKHERTTLHGPTLNGQDHCINMPIA